MIPAMKETTLITLNSFFPAGCTTLLLHLASVSHNPIISYTPDGEFQHDDVIFPKDSEIKVTQLSDGDFPFGDQHYKYGIIVVGRYLRRYLTEYKFLDNIAADNLAVYIHDVRDFVGYAMDGLNGLFDVLGDKIKILFCADEDTKKVASGYGYPVDIIKQPYNREFLPKFLSSKGRTIVCHSRDSAIKNIDKVSELADKTKCEFLRITGNYSYNTLAKILSISSFVVDASTARQQGASGRTQYCLLEAMDSGCIPICTSDFFCDDLIPDVTCLEFSEKTFNMIAKLPETELYTMRETFYENSLRVLRSHRARDIYKHMVNELVRYSNYGLEDK